MHILDIWTRPRSVARQAASRASSTAGSRWTKKSTLYGFAVASVIAESSARIACGVRRAHGREPRPPAFDTAIASALPCEPAIGAWMTGISVRKVMLTPEQLLRCGRAPPPTALSLQLLEHVSKLGPGCQVHRLRRIALQVVELTGRDPPRRPVHPGDLPRGLRPR